jgi:RNA polymerase sigma-70 factor (ECF subfamily)
VQETFAKALRGFDSFSPGTDSHAWIFRILRNTFLTSRTGLQAKLTVPLDAEDGADLGNTRNTRVASTSREALKSAPDELPIAYREVILLCDVEEMKYKDIAEVLSVPHRNHDVAAGTRPQAAASPAGWR